MENEIVIFQVLTAANVKMRAFWDMVPCSLGVDRRFRSAYSIITLMMETETSVYPKVTTRLYIAEGSQLLK
jgi:hypothetical protein